jgi:subtilisin family serine protease
MVAAVATSMAVPGVAQAAPGDARYVVALEDTVTDPVGVAAEQARVYGAETRAVFASVNGYSALMTATEAAAVAADPAVQSVAVDGVAATVGRVPLPVNCQEATSLGPQCLPEDIDRIDGELSSTHSGNGGGAGHVTIAVIDTGVDNTHPELNVVGGVDCSSGQPVEGASAFHDVIGHGTFVAGVAAARDNGDGVVGIAPGAPIYSVKVFDDVTGTASDAAVICAADWVTKTLRDDDPGNDIAVANMSFGGTVPSDDGRCGRDNGDLFHTAICRSVRHGTLYVAAAGNASTDFATIAPATYDEVLTATAMDDFDGAPGGSAPAICYGIDLGSQFGDQDDVAAPYSNFATLESDRQHTVAAPGTCVTSTLPGNGYGAADGTSFAAPLVSGTAALCISDGRCPAFRPLQAARRIQADAAEYNRAHPEYGFLGDPVRQELSGYYGFLVRAAAY